MHVYSRRSICANAKLAVTRYAGLQGTFSVAMNKTKGTRSVPGSWRHVGTSLACVVLAVALSCATARLDPERNQALTFDAIFPDDAGIAPPVLRSASVKSAPSQVGAAADETTDQHADAGFSGEPITCTVDPPDPKPLHTRDWIAYEFAYKEGVINLRSQRGERTAKPRDTARVVGRYAVELWIGCELIDRVRFSFPLQAAEQPITASTRHALNEQLSLTAKANLTRTVLVPFDSRATRAELIDRGTGKRSSLAWPPNLPPLSNSSSPRSSKIPSPAIPAAGSQ